MMLRRLLEWRRGKACWSASATLQYSTLLLTLENAKPIMMFLGRYEVVRILSNCPRKPSSASSIYRDVSKIIEQMNFNVQRC